MEKNKFKNLWIVSYHLHPVWSGAGERFLRYNDLFQKKDIKVTYISAFIEGTSKKEYYRGANIIRLDKGDKKPSFRQFIKLAAKMAREAEAKPDAFVVLIASYFNVSDILSLAKINIKTIYVNTMMFSISPSKNILKRYISKQLNIRFFNAFDKIVCSTSILKQPILKLGIDSKKIEVISNGVSLSRFRPALDEEEKQSIIEKLDLPSDEPIFLYVGLIVKRKGISDLVTFWKKYKEGGGKGYLLMVGGEQRGNALFTEFYNDWDNLVSTIKEKHKIIFHPPSNHIEYYYRVCRGFLFLSEKEGHGNVLIESMASGCPVITTEFEGFSFFEVKNTDGILVVEKKSEEVIDAIEKVLFDELYYQSIKDNALKYVENQHGLDSTIEKYINLI